MLTGRGARGTTWRVLDEWIGAVVVGGTRQQAAGEEGAAQPEEGARQEGGSAGTALARDVPAPNPQAGGTAPRAEARGALGLR